jgi:hypothetical protein
MRIDMTAPYKIIPVLLLAFYALCAVCPERVVPALAMQTAEASETHDCHSRGRHKPESDCRTAFSEFLRTAEVKFSHVLAVQALLLPEYVLTHAFGLLLRLRTTHFSTAGPPSTSLKINLRI